MDARAEPDRDQRLGLSVVLAAEFGRLGLTFVARFLQDCGDFRVGNEVLPARPIPVEEHPDPIVLIGIAKDGRALGSMLPSLLSALGREDLQRAVEVLDLGRCQDRLCPPLWGSVMGTILNSQATCGTRKLPADRRARAGCGRAEPATFRRRRPAEAGHLLRRCDYFFGFGKNVASQSRSSAVSIR
jgi:hypothetical protein